MRKEHHRVSLTVPKINESERVGMKPGPVCSDSFWSHCVCAYSSSQTLGSSVHPEGHILHSTGEKLCFSFHCPLHSNIMVQFLRNHMTFMPHSTKNVRKRILIFLIAPGHLTHPRSICLMRQPLTFPTKAYTEHAPGRELPTRGTNRATEKNTSHS